MNMCKPGGLSCCLCSALAPWQLTHCFWCFLSYFRFNMQVTRGALGQFFRQLSKWSIQQLLSNHLFSEFVWKCRTAWDGPVSLPNFKIHRYQKKFKRIQKIVSGCSRLGFRSKSAKSHVQFQRLQIYITCERRAACYRVSWNTAITMVTWWWCCYML